MKIYNFNIDSAIYNYSNYKSRQTSFLKGNGDYYEKVTSSDLPNHFHNKKTNRNSEIIACQLKRLNGSLDEKVLKAKDVILRNFGIPPELIKCEELDCGQDNYAATSFTQAKIYYNKKQCQNPNSKFSDDAVLCILYHEVDHLMVLIKLYKFLGKDEFEKFLNGLDILKKLPPNMKKIDHEIFRKLIPYVDIKDFEAEKYMDALQNYDTGSGYTGTEYSNYQLFNSIIDNFDNELENSARNAQYDLEQKMGVTTLKDFYLMIDATKELNAQLQEFQDKHQEYSSKKDFVEITFDYLYDKSMKELNLEDTSKNWGIILKNSQKYVQNMSGDDIDAAYKLRTQKLSKI